MIKKFLFGLIICCFLLTGIAIAQPETPAVVEPVVTTETTVVEQPPELRLGEVLEGLPALKQGAVYLIKENQFQYISTIEAIEWKGLTLEVGYAPADTAVAGISYRVLRLRDLGVNIPILDLVEFNVGFVAGATNIGSDIDFDYGPAVTLINVKF
jgi:hypothetical protein